MTQRLLLISFLIIYLSLQAYSKSFISSISSNNPFKSSDNANFRPIRNSPEILAGQTSNNFNEDYATDTDSTDSESFDSYVPVMALSYYGNWISTGSADSAPLNYFSENSGYASFTADDEGSSDLDDGINVWIYDGPYKDQKGAYINFVYVNATDFNPETSTFSNPNITFNVSLLNNGATQNILTCTGSYQLNILDSCANNTPYQAGSYDYDCAVAQFQMSSSDCNLFISMNSAVDDSAAEDQAMEYTIMVTIICVACLYACIQMIRQISLNETDGARYSLQTFSIFTAWDVFLCIFHFYGALTTEVYFHYFITPAFWYFILASILEARLLLLIWKGKYYQTFQNVQDLRRGLTWFYAGFYSFLGAFLLTCYFVLPETWFFYATSFFFVPQIIHNAIRGQKYKFDANYVFLLGVLRILVPLYVKSYPGSMFRYTPDDSFALFYIGIVFSQVVFLHLQSKIGSRFFVPSWLLPPVHNYFVKVPITGCTEEGEADVCAICMENLDHESSDLKTELVKNEKFFTVMQTPCKHNFHEKCLKEWMEIKLECPFCRTNLPAIE